MSRTKFIAYTIAALLIAAGGRAQAAPAAPAVPEQRPAAAEKKLRIKIEIPAQTRNYTEQTLKPQRERGRKLFQRGNQMFERREVDNAIKLYRQAYKLWPHPRVLFNIAVSLGFLSRPLESARTFRTVLEYGPEPINKQRFKQASERYIELMGQLTNLIITCQDQGAKLYINGKPVGTAPMLNKKVTLGPGTHMITASLSGKVPYSAQVRLSPGELKRVQISLQAFSDVVRYRKVSRYHWAVPTIVTIGAALLAGGGVGLLMSGRNSVGTIQDEVNQAIATYGTSVPFYYDTNKESQALGMQKGGWALLGTAGAAAVTALVLWIMRKKKVRYTVGSTTKGGNVKIRF